MRKLVLIAALLMICGAVFGSGQSGETMDSVKLTPPGTFPIVEEKIELSYMIQSSPNVSDYDDNLLTQLLEERTNVKINLRLTPSKDYSNKMNLMFASKSELPDMVQLGRIDLSAQLMWGEQGVLMPLNDLIAEQCALLKKAFAELPMMEMISTAADGNIYSFPFHGDCYHCDPATRFWINQVWLDDLGLERPTTTEEFKQVLNAFKTRDPNGNGKSDEIPLVGSITGWNPQPHSFLLNSFVNWSDTRYGFYVDDGTITPAFTEPAYRDGLRYLKELVDEGLLDPVSFTQDVNQLKQLVTSDPKIVGVWLSGLSPGMWYGEEDGVINYTDLDPLKGPDGVRMAQFNPYALIGTGQAALTTETKYPEVAARWMDQFFDEETATISRFGVKDLHWRYQKPGENYVTSEKVPAGGVMLEDVWGQQQPMNIHWYLAHPYYLPNTMETADWETFDMVAQMGKSTTNLNKYTAPPETQVPPLALRAEDVDEYNDLRTTVDTYVDESRVLFIVGDLDLDSDWDSYLSELEAMGLDRFIELQQKAYDAVWK